MKYLEILLGVGYFICVSPKYNFKTTLICTSKWHNLYTILTTTAVILICIFIFATNPMYKIPNILITGKLLHIGYCICITGATTSALLTPLLQPQAWKKLLNNLQTLDTTFLGMDNSFKQSYKLVAWKIFFLYLIIVLKDVYVMVCTSKKAPALYGYLMYTELYKYYTYTPLLIYIRINGIMKNKYKYMGCLLKKSVRDGHILMANNTIKYAIGTIPTKQNASAFRVKVMIMRRACQKLMHTGEVHNSIFGFQIFFTIGYTFLRNLERFSGSLSIKKETNSTIFNNMTENPFYFWATQIAAVSNVVVCCAVILSADGVKRQAKRLLDTCHALENYSEASKAEIEISKFIKLLSVKTPQFSAAGFFNVDRTTLFSILSASTTYYVALVQYNQSNL